MIHGLYSFFFLVFFFFKQKTAYEMRISDWSSDVCSSDLACRSVWHTPVAAILTRICPGPTVGIGASSMTRGLPNSRTTAAFMVFAMSVSPFERGVRTGRARARHRRRAGSWSADNGRASSGDFHARSPTPCIRRRRHGRGTGDSSWSRPARPRSRGPDGRRCCRRSEEHTSELQSLLRISYAVLCCKQKKNVHATHQHPSHRNPCSLVAAI